MPFNGEVIWIIGASSGIGRALAIELAQQGATLILSARSQPALELLNNNLANKHHVVPFDVADFEQVKRAAESLRLRGINVNRMICMAATYAPGNLHDFEVAQAQHVVNVNLMGAIYLIHEVLPMLKGVEGAQMVFCSSVAGFRGLPGGQPYCATKAALTNLVESLAIETRGEIDVKVIHPGFVRTPLTDKNDFVMPMIIEADVAARHIAKGLRSRAFEIHFPKKFTFIMKCLHLLPPPIYFWVLRMGMSLGGIKR